MKGSGLFNKLIDKLPFEVHIPGYRLVIVCLTILLCSFNFCQLTCRFCGPGTKLEERINQTGINPLDSACKEHDVAYAQSKELDSRHKADKVLAEKSWERVKAKNASIGERVAALGVTGAMRIKRKLGMGLKRKLGMGMKKCLKRGKGLKNKSRKKRIIKTPKKIGGFLPLLVPLLGALGALGAGAATIASSVNKANASKKQLEESQRHNKAMEALATGKGLVFKPRSKVGKGMFLAPFKKNFQ